MKVSREYFLSELEAVQPGLSPKEIVEQSSSFIFYDKRVRTYNDEIACSFPTKLRIAGAVQSSPLLSLLQKLSEDEVDVEQNGKELLIRGKNRVAGIRMDAEILLPMHNVEEPKQWRSLPSEFCEAVEIVRTCVSKDASQFVMTCVHLHPKALEACDNYQLIRYPLKVGFREPILVRGDSLQHVAEAGVTEFSVTESWCHFRSPAGLVLSCRLSKDPYPSLDKNLDVTGEPSVLPKGLGEAAEKAEIFSAENVKQNQVLVRLKEGKIQVRGEGVTGWYRETKRLKYHGPAISFLISPKMLIDLTRQHCECEIAKDRLKVDAGHYVYVTALDVVKGKE